MASTAHTTSTCSRGTARMRPPRGRWAPDHVKLVLSRAVLIVPCRVVWHTSCAPPHLPAPAPCPPARYARARRALLFSGGTARWSPSLARSRSRRRRVPQARRPSCGRWSRWRCGPRRSRRSSWPPLAAIARGALLTGGAQGEGAHAGRGHGRQHRHHPRGLSRGQGAVAQARATRVRGHRPTPATSSFSCCSGSPAAPHQLCLYCAGRGPRGVDHAFPRVPLERAHTLVLRGDWLRLPLLLQSRLRDFSPPAVSSSDSSLSSASF